MSKTTIYDGFLEGVMTIKHHDNFYLQGDRDMIYIGVTSEDYPEDSHMGKQLLELGFCLDNHEGCWYYYT